MSPSKQTEVMMSIRSRYLAALVIILSIFLFVGCSLFGPEQKKQLKGTKSYVSLDLELTKYKSMLQAIENKLGYKLKSRGEAHITVITPPEYKKLTQKISAQVMDQLSNDFLKSPVHFTTVCIGTSKKRSSEVYYVVVESKDLLSFRMRLSEAAGISKQDFDPQLFFPHITLGFTDHDLHYEDGVIKNSSTCPSELQSALGKSK